MTRSPTAEEWKANDLVCKDIWWWNIEFISCGSIKMEGTVLFPVSKCSNQIVTAVLDIEHEEIENQWS